MCISQAVDQSQRTGINKAQISSLCRCIKYSGYRRRPRPTSWTRRGLLREDYIYVKAVEQSQGTSSNNVCFGLFVWQDKPEMATSKIFSCSLVQSMLLLLILSAVNAKLQVGFYEKTCPNAEKIVKEVMGQVMSVAPSLSGPLLRMHFHDCFVRVNCISLS